MPPKPWRTPCRRRCPSATAGTTSAPWHWYWASAGELITAAPDGTAWRAENLRLTRTAEALADTVPEALPLSDRWDDLCTLALVLGQRR